MYVARNRPSSPPRLVSSAAGAEITRLTDVPGGRGGKSPKARPAPEAGMLKSERTASHAARQARLKSLCVLHVPVRLLATRRASIGPRNTIATCPLSPPRSHPDGARLLRPLVPLPALSCGHAPAKSDRRLHGVALENPPRTRAPRLSGLSSAQAGGGGGGKKKLTLAHRRHLPQNESTPFSRAVVCPGIGHRGARPGLTEVTDESGASPSVMDQRQRLRPSQAGRRSPRAIPCSAAASRCTRPQPRGAFFSWSFPSSPLRGERYDRKRRGGRVVFQDRGRGQAVHAGSWMAMR